MIQTSEELVPIEPPRHPEFATERLALGRERATALVRDALKNVTATDTPEGRKFRTTDGMLIAILTGPADGPETTLQYRTAPAGESATLKARKLWRTLRPHASSG